MTYTNQAPSPARTQEKTGTASDLALQKLIEGDRRYVDGRPNHPNQTSERRIDVADTPHPFAVTLSCSDSRVPPEVIFDCGLGDLFVVRNAGNIINDEVLGSIEYAVEYFGTRLVVVMGHNRCGAVSAAVQGGEFQGHIPSLINAIRPAVERVKSKSGNLIENAVNENVAMMVEKLKSTSPVLKRFIKNDNLNITGALYDMDNGNVVFNK